MGYFRHPEVHLSVILLFAVHHGNAFILSTIIIVQESLHAVTHVIT